jgi:hypothetical protein
MTPEELKAFAIELAAALPPVDLADPPGRREPQQVSAAEPAAEYPDNFYSGPVFGNFTAETGAHLRQALALSCVIYGEGYEPFSKLNDQLQNNVLWLLSSEIQRACQAYDAERKGITP